VLVFEHNVIQNVRIEQEKLQRCGVRRHASYPAKNVLYSDFSALCQLRSVYFHRVTYKMST
jgi:hypothetical protein